MYSELVVWAYLEATYLINQKGWLIFYSLYKVHFVVATNVVEVCLPFELKLGNYKIFIDFNSSLQKDFVVRF